MVASQGGSPSGRFTAVLGRSNSPPRVPGLRSGEAGVICSLGFGGPETLRVTGVVFRGSEAPGGDAGVAFALVLVGEEVLPPIREPSAGGGVDTPST